MKTTSKRLCSKAVKILRVQKFCRSAKSSYQDRWSRQQDIISSIVKGIPAKVKSSLLIIKLKHSGNVWKKVIKQKYPGAVSTGARVKTDKKGKKDGRKNVEQDLSNLDNSD